MVTTILKSHSQSVLDGSEAQPAAVFLMLSLGVPGGAAQAGLGTVWAADCESLPAGFCGDPGAGLRIEAVLVTEQTVGPPL